MAARESIIRRFYSLQTSSLLPSFLFHFARFHLLCVVEMLRLVCGKKYGGVVVVRLHHSLHANFDKRGKLRENCDRAKRFLQGSCFFFFFFLLRHRSGVINEISNASRDSNVFQFASNFRLMCINLNSTIVFF